MNEYLMNIMAKQRIYEAMRDAATARIAKRAREADGERHGGLALARNLLRRAARAFHGYPAAGAPASWRDTSRA